MSTVRYANEEIRKRKGRVNLAKVRAATEEQIAAWKREDGFEDAMLGAMQIAPPVPDVRALRERLGLSQEEFSTRYMLGLRTVQEWEQRRREPSEAARVLLYAIAQDPDTIARRASSTPTPLSANEDGEVCEEQTRSGQSASCERLV